jgi:hypothetical protein
LSPGRGLPPAPGVRRFFHFSLQCVAFAVI